MKSDIEMYILESVYSIIYTIYYIYTHGWQGGALTPPCKNKTNL